jgi:hypothetical protein
VSTKMYIFGEGRLWTDRSPSASCSDLERDLRHFLQDRGEVIWDGDEHCGPQWNVDLLLHAEPEDVDGWIDRLTAFLRLWGISDRTLSFTIIREGTTSKWEHRRIEVGDR